ncbi:MAG: hydantoinase/oxoprolinase family protein [Thermodesulfobacteriota bacterium]|nr:hydantoinase/oxoprolinase family protein [Thermodesulfobacteriota bacterium]
MIRLGIDTGGTFTDFVVWNEHKLLCHKVPSTPDDPAKAIIEGLRNIFKVIPEGVELIHGTTVGTNAFLERKGERSALITTKGFEDLIFIGRQNRPELYDFSVQKPECIVTKDECFGVSERTYADGSIAKIPKEKEIRTIKALLKENHFTSVTICFLHAYANPQNEQMVAKWLKDDTLTIHLSSQVLPEFREYERICTTLINAYISPIVSKYIQKLATCASKTILRIQKSNGGTLTAQRACKKAIHTILSGPAGGLVGAFKLSQKMGEHKIITLDMGGTSTDVALCDGELPFTKEYELDGYPIGIPVLDIHTVGAGGGSIAYVDRGGALKVGPESAGAFPGPVCYGKGKQLTVTDAHLFLGRILPKFFLGSKKKLYSSRTEEKMCLMATQIRLSPAETALGIIQVANAHMVKAIREVSLERGYDPREFSLFCFGGASGLHACALATTLEIKRIIIPREAGILSALGMILSKPSAEYTQTVFFNEENLTEQKLLGAIKKLTQRGYRELKEDGFLPENLEYQVYLDIRYEGQSYELTIPYTSNFIEVFHKRHHHLFGHYFQDKRFEITTLRVTFKVQSEIPEIRQLEEKTVTPEEVLIQEHNVTFIEEEKRIPVFSWEKLGCGFKITGPALIVDRFSTVLLTEAFELKINEYGSIVMDRR